MPSLPQAVSALSTSSTTVLVAWTEPAVAFREHTHTTHVFIYVQYNGTVLCVLVLNYLSRKCTQLVLSYGMTCQYDAACTGSLFDMTHACSLLYIVHTYSTHNNGTHTYVL